MRRAINTVLRAIAFRPLMPDGHRGDCLPGAEFNFILISLFYCSRYCAAGGIAMLAKAIFLMPYFA